MNHKYCNYNCNFQVVFCDWFISVIQQFFEELFAAVKSAGWYNNSDAMIDYFDTAYYFDVNVGRWNKPYELTA